MYMHGIGTCYVAICMRMFHVTACTCMELGHVTCMLHACCNMHTTRMFHVTVHVHAWNWDMLHACSMHVAICMHVPVPEVYSARLHVTCMLHACFRQHACFRKSVCYSATGQGRCDMPHELLTQHALFCIGVDAKRAC